VIAPRLRWQAPVRGERGSAIADFVLVSVVLVPLFLAIVQLAVIWHIKNTVTAAASEGARYGAAYDATPQTGAGRTRAILDQTFGSDFDAEVVGSQSGAAGSPVVEVTVRARVPVLAFWGPSVAIEADGHAIKEILP